MATSLTARPVDTGPTDAEFNEAIKRSDCLELVTADELRELFADRWTLTEGGRDDLR